MKVLNRITVLVVAFAWSTTTLAETMIEEIIVTAQKREQSLQDVPISVVAISGERLNSLQRNEIADLTKVMPGVTYKDGSTDNGRSLQIRGIGTTSFSRGIEQSVGMLIDGVPTNSLATSFLDMNDVQRVEVLRGPQGMLFGKNSSAGLINIITNDPTEELEWGLSASFGDESEQKYTGYVSGALSDTLQGRLSFSSSQRDGFIKSTNPATSDYNDRDEQALNLKLLFRPTDDLDITFGYKLLERGNLNAGAVVVETYSPPFSGFYPLLAQAAGGTLPSGKENDEGFFPNDSDWNTELDIYSLEVNYALGDYTFTSITALQEADIVGNALGFAIPVNLIPRNLSIGDREQWSQEFRLHSPIDQDLTWVLGFYYYKNELDRTFNRTIDLNAFVGLPFVQSNSIVGEMENKSTAIFGQATWNVSDTFRLSFGGRFTDEEISLYQVQSFINPDPVTGLPSIPEATPGIADTSEDETNFSWRVIAEWDIGEDAMVFANAARGYKGPGANMLSSAPIAPKVIVDPEIPTNFEVGLKSNWMDGQLQLNATAFYTEFEDFQASLSTIVNLTPAFFLDNAGELQTQGLEVELSFLPTENLLVGLNAAFIDATFEDYPGAECYGGQTEAQGCIGGQQDLSGKDMPYSPDTSYSLFARYDLPLESLTFNMYAQALYFWRDDAIYATNNNPATEVDAYGLLDLGLGIESDDGRFGAQIWVKNATDEFYPSDVIVSPGFGLGYGYNLEYTYTRRVGVTLSMDF